MNDFEMNKIAGAILGTLTLTWGVVVIAQEIWASHPPEKPGYEIAVAEEPTQTGGPTQAEAAEPIAVRLAAADVAKGEAASKPCLSCHTFEKGGANKVGPNLYDVVDRQKAGVQGFAYSQVLQTKGQAGEKWTYEHLDGFLENPKGYHPGTSMSFAGIKRAGQRGDVIAYLRSLSEAPKPLPAAAADAPVRAAQN